MSVQLRDYQTRLLSEIEALFQKGEKEVCLAASCGAGKTYMAIHYIADFLKEHPTNRVVVTAEGQVLLRNQFAEKARKLNLFDFDVVKSGSALALSKKRVVITLPQTIHHVSSVPHFGLAVVDEAHHFYEQNMVQTILRKAQPQRTLLLTGTPAPFVAKKTPIVAVAMSELFTEGFVPELYFELVSTNEPIKNKHYNRQGNLTTTYRFRQTEKALASVLPLLDSRLRSYRNGTLHDWTPSVFKTWRIRSGAWELPKTLIACNNREQAKLTKRWFDARGISCVMSVSGAESWADRLSKEIEKFKESDCCVLVVVGRGILGFDYDELVNFVDMTFHRDLNGIHQGYSRLARHHPNGTRKLFVKVVPSDSAPYFRWVMEAAMLLTHRDWLLKYNGQNFRELEIPVRNAKRKGGKTGGPGGGGSGSGNGKPRYLYSEEAPDFGVDCPIFGKIMKDLGLLLNSPFCPYRRVTLGKVKAGLDDLPAPWQDDDDEWLRKLADPANSQADDLALAKEFLQKAGELSRWKAFREKLSAL